jgi:uncharacterized protein (TIGR03437 family)
MLKMRWLILLLLSSYAVYSADFTTYIGGGTLMQYPGVAAVVADAAGNTYVAGSRIVLPPYSGGAFLTKLDAAGSVLYTKAIAPDGSYANCIAIDPAGNIWIGGQTEAANFPLTHAVQSSGTGGTGFLVKLSADGTIVYSSYFGGSLGVSGVNGVATDGSGNVYVTGFTGASDFPTTPGLPGRPVRGGSAPVNGLFAAKLDPNGQTVLYSTVIAGPGNCDFCFPIPTTMGMGIAVDGGGNALVAGETNTTDLQIPTTGAGGGAFVFKIDAGGDRISYFTYIGAGAVIGNVGTPDTNPASPITADVAGNAYVAGYATDAAFSTTHGAYLGAYPAGGNDPGGFVMKLDSNGNTEWSTFLGSGLNMANAVSLDSSHNVWMTGTSGTPAAESGSFVTELSADGSALRYSGEFPAGGAGQAIAVDAGDAIHFAGPSGLVSTAAGAEPSAPRVVSIVNAASGQHLGLVAAGEIVSLYGSGMAPETPVSGTPQNGLFPTSLGGVQVVVNGSPVPLLYVSASQINAEIPSAVSGGASGLALMQVVNNGITLPDFRIAVLNSDFAVFQKAGGSMVVTNESMVVTNEDGTVNKIANPAKAGSVVSIWATGFGATDPPVVGAVAAGANNYCSMCQVRLNYESTSVVETVQYAGTSPGLIDGLMQMNIASPSRWSFPGAWVSFTPPGSAFPVQLGWVNIGQ